MPGFCTDRFTLTFIFTIFFINLTILKLVKGLDLDIFIYMIYNIIHTYYGSIDKNNKPTV